MALTYRIAGTILAVVFATAGLATAASLLPLVVVIGLVSGLCTYNAVQDDKRARTWLPDRSPRSLAVMLAVGTVAAVYTVIGMVVLLGASIGLLLLTTVLACAAYRVLQSRQAASDPAPSTPSAAAEPVDGSPTPAGRPRSATLLPPEAGAVSTADLCRAWRVSYSVLENARAPAQLAEAATLRRRYLDELERRDPAGFRRWFDDGARAASDPARYIRPRLGSPAQEDDATA